MKPPPVLVPTQATPADAPAMTSASLPYLLRTTALMLRRQAKLGRHSSQLDWLMDRAVELASFVRDLEEPPPGLDGELVQALKAATEDLSLVIEAVGLPVDPLLNHRIAGRLEAVAFQLT